MKLIAHYSKNEKGSWDLTITTGSEVLHIYPRSRLAGINRMLAALWKAKPGDEFTITTEWEEVC